MEDAPNKDYLLLDLPARKTEHTPVIAQVRKGQGHYVIYIPVSSNT